MTYTFTAVLMYVTTSPDVSPVGSKFGKATRNQTQDASVQAVGLAQRSLLNGKKAKKENFQSGPPGQRRNHIF